MSKPVWLTASLLAVALPAVAANKTIASLDLQAAFHTRAPWTFTATQGPDVPDETSGSPGDTIAGIITPCLSQDHGKTCDPILTQALRPDMPDDGFYADPHFLDQATVEHLPGGRPILLIKARSVYSVDGDQVVVLRAFTYDRAHDRFTLAYRHSTGHNNNQDVRFMTSGPLSGAIIAAEPTQGAPFGFWMTVDTLSATGVYKQRLKYRSATGYGDGNPLGVIDSEMPNMLQHLGKWKPGQALPLPSTPCTRPHLVHMELWCE